MAYRRSYSCIIVAVIYYFVERKIYFSPSWSRIHFFFSLSRLHLQLSDDFKNMERQQSSIRFIEPTWNTSSWIIPKVQE
jgi:hypothetical protein